MSLEVDPRRLQAALVKARNALLAERNARGHWTGELSSSALSTATAVCALQIVRRERRSSEHETLIERGLRWLAKNQNADGGWGDTDLSFSNISTTTLCWAVFGVVPGADERFADNVRKAREWLRQHAGSLDADALADAIIKRYGKDRTFSVPILTMCALCGRLGDGAEAWRRVIPLPFELAAFPPNWFAALRLPVVSYALPALIAIGQARHRRAPSRNPLARAARNAVAERTLKVLERIQPSNGGFLEATPLTSFVTMSLAGSGLADHPVTRKGAEFLAASARPDGSWPIDTNLATWVTTLSVNALANDPSFQLPGDERRAIREWLLGQQYRTVHPYTNAAPGGWAWTDLPGGVPDADDTAGALLALKNLGGADERVREAASLGVKWLSDLQNRDGGIPTFCRGWTNLPFDRSGADLTAHAIRAWLAWSSGLLEPAIEGRARESVLRAIDYLVSRSCQSGVWVPLWFGNQHCHDDQNGTYGTSKTLIALSGIGAPDHPLANTQLLASGLAKFGEAVRHLGARYLQSIQQPDGAFGGSQGTPSSVEESALATEALFTHCAALEQAREEYNPELLGALVNGANHLIHRVETGAWTQPAPIGFYFARLWYYEKLYPMIFTVGALGKAKAALEAGSKSP